MIIKCLNCKKNFDLDLSLIPENGRSLQCGFCNHKWFFKLNNEISLKNLNEEIKAEDDQIQEFDNNTEVTTNFAKISIDSNNEKIDKSNKSLSNKKNIKSSGSKSIKNFLSLIVVILISFVALIIVADTFKILLEKIFPGTELLLYNLFETMNDIYLFFMNLID